MKTTKFLKVAKQAATYAGRIISTYSGKFSIQKDLGGSDITTKADYEAEEKIIEIITSAFPDHNIVSEERGRLEKSSKYTWVVDPLDGTVSFITGIPSFAVSIGLLKDNQPILGIVNRITDKELYWAEQGYCTFLNGQKISVSKTTKLENAFLGSDFGYKSRGEDIKRQFIPLIDKVRYFYVLGGVTSSAALVSKGIFDGYLHKAKVWDFAAVAVLVTEAGGKVTDQKGNLIDWTREWVEMVASNGLIHDKILEALKEK